MTKDNNNETFRYINSFDVKNSWAAIAAIIIALILLLSIIVIGVIYIKTLI